MTRHALILADIEGIIGVYDKAQCTPGADAWRQARHLLTDDVNAAARGLLDAGYHAITVGDMHGTGFNILPEKLMAEVRCVQGHRWHPVPLIGTMPEADCAVMVGWHAAPDQEGFSPHIFQKTLRKLCINGSPVTEVELFSAVLGEHGIPVSFVSAEAVACDRIQGNMPWIHRFDVPKRPISQTEINTLRARLTDEVRQVASGSNTTPLVWGPHEVTATFPDETRTWTSPSATTTFRRLLADTALGFAPDAGIPLLLFILRTRCRMEEWTRKRQPPAARG
ncbi:M55 family metallopeptidase [Desulfoluna spongiiphila]|uniref:D-amino peptidase n=1 Tax=Desulfoluna spongiiphila TaxID=419481 RepID=A0A1G5BR53_9BACT|nr:M55 family metallopeptidase [Desulfoluna spongiiphila]SCX92603.1 D-amino peptidase [Desulfoluna spongiiphila]